MTKTCFKCGKHITEEEMKNETFVWIREFRHGKKNKIEWIDGSLSFIVHKRCFVPSRADEHPCKQGLVE